MGQAPSPPVYDYVEAEFSEVRRRHVRDYLRILYKYRWLAAALFVVTLGVTVLVTLLTPRSLTIEACGAPEVAGPPKAQPGIRVGAAPGKIENCALGFGIGYHDPTTDLVYLVPVPIVKYTCMINGHVIQG